MKKLCQILIPIYGMALLLSACAPGSNPEGENKIDADIPTIPKEPSKPKTKKEWLGGLDRLPQNSLKGIRTVAFIVNPQDEAADLVDREELETHYKNELQKAGLNVVENEEAPTLYLNLNGDYIGQTFAWNRNIALVETVKSLREINGEIVEVAAVGEIWTSRAMYYSGGQHIKGDMYDSVNDGINNFLSGVTGQ